MYLKSYKELIVWQKSFQLAKIIYKLTRHFPKSEIYGLVSQMQRCSVSIVSNIAEGYSRGHRQEYLQFLRVAFGSGAELETQMLLAKELKLISNSEFDEAFGLLTEVMKMLNVLIHKLNPNP